MTLKERLNADLREAMRAQDERRRSTLRMAIAAIRNAEIPPSQEEVAEDAAPVGRTELNDEGVLQVLRKEVKQRRDSIDQFQKAGRTDLVEKESAEIAILETYLPAQMSREQITAAARDVIAETGAAGPAGKAKVMPVLMKRLSGQAEGRLINEVVTELLRQ